MNKKEICYRFLLVVFFFSMGIHISAFVLGFLDNGSLFLGWFMASSIRLIESYHFKCINFLKHNLSCDYCYQKDVLKMYEENLFPNVN